MDFRIKYHCGEKQIGETKSAASLDEAHKLIAATAADLGHKAEVALIFRLSPSGTEELEESRKLHC